VNIQAAAAESAGNFFLQRLSVLMTDRKHPFSVCLWQHTSCIPNSCIQVPASLLALALQENAKMEMASEVSTLVLLYNPFFHMYTSSIPSCFVDSAMLPIRLSVNLDSSMHAV
jgi:hypothetical protein